MILYIYLSLCLSGVLSTLLLELATNVYDKAMHKHIPFFIHSETIFVRINTRILHQITAAMGPTCG